MGFLDLSGSLGRHFGSIGLPLNEITTQLTLIPQHHLEISGAAQARAGKYTRQLCRELGVPDTFKINIESAIPEHVGLGSGTQLSLAIGMGLNALYGLGLNVRDVAKLSDRGKRSGIGIAVFEQGGLVVDGGRGEHTLTPPVIVRMPIPENLRFILIFDRRGQGLHGHQEIQAFKALPCFPAEQAARLCYLLLMQGLPAFAEGNIRLFGDVITELQQAVGTHFAAAQGGVFTSSEVAEAIAWLQSQGAVAIGQTSWGPTGFCALEGAEKAAVLVKQVQAKFTHLRNLGFFLASGRNLGGTVVAR